MTARDAEKFWALYRQGRYEDLVFALTGMNDIPPGGLAVLPIPA